MPRSKINYPLAVTLLSANATLAEVAPQVGAKNADVLRVGLARRRVTVGLIRSQPFHPDRIESEANNVLLQVSRLVREKLSTELDQSVDVLAAIPKSRTLKHLKERAAVIEPLARTAKTVFQWGEDAGVGVVTVGDMAGFLDVVEVPALPPASQAAVPCGVESTVTPQLG
jgi:hypothetical protein